MKKYYLFASLVLLAASPGFAQVKIGAPGAPDGSAMLEVTSGPAGNKGLLLPKMTTAQRNAITSPANGLMIYNTTANEVQVNTGTPASPTWVTATATAAGWTITGNTGTNPGTNFIGTSDNQPMVVRTNNTEKVRVTAAGNVGIGTDAPAVKLQVVDTGDVAIRVGSPTGGRGHIELGNNNHGFMRNLSASGGGVNDVAVYTSTGSIPGNINADLHLVANPTASGSDNLPLNQFVLKNTGRVGIGTKDPATRLHVDTGGLRISNGATALANPAIEVINDGGGPGTNDNIVISSYGSNTQPSIGTQSARGTASAPQNSQAGDNIGNFYFNSRVNGAIVNSNLIRGTYLGNGTTNRSRLAFLTSNTVAMSIDSNQNVGVGTTAPQQTLHVAGTARITGSSGTATTITGRNAAGDVSNVTVGAGLSLTGGTLTATGGGSDWGLTGNAGTNPATNFIGTSDNQPMVVRTNNTEKVRVTAAGNVGIGTSTVPVRLQVADTGNAAIRVGSTTGGRAMVNLGLGNGFHGIVRNLTNSGGGPNDVALYTSSSPSSPASIHLAANPTATDSLNLNQFVLKNTGNVGIGTAAPAVKLQVMDTGDAAIRIGNAEGGRGHIQLGNNNHGLMRDLSASGGGANDVAVYTSSGGPAANLYLVANPLASGSDNLPLDQFVLTTAGNVGIGTGTPAQTLHVAGTARITGSSGTATTITGRNATGDVSNVAIGTGLSLTSGTLSVTGGTNDWDLTGNAGTNPATNFIGTSDNQPMVVRTNNTEKVRVTAAGSVGIGTNAPVAKLHVVDTGNTAIVVSSTSAVSGNKMSVNFGSSSHGVARNLTNSGGLGNDVALYTSSGPTAAAEGTLYLASNPIASDSIPLTQFALKKNGNIGIGTNTPAAKLHVHSGNITISNDGPVSGSAINVISDNGGGLNPDNISITTYGSSNPSFGISTARGTLAAPTNNQAGDNTGSLFFAPRVNGAFNALSGITTNYLGNGTTAKSRLNLMSSGGVALTIDSSRYVGIGVTNPNAKLHVNGGIMVARDTNLTYGNGGMMLWSSVRSGIGEMEFINFHGTGSGGFRFYDVDPSPIVGTADTGSWIAYIMPGTGTYQTPSDSRVKTNVNIINDGLEKVMAMRPVSYDLHTGRKLKDGAVTFTQNDKTISTIGFIAQELVKIVPEAVNIPNDPSNELYSVSYATVVPVLTKAIQEQQALIESLKAELASVKADNTALKADASKITELSERMKQLEALMGTPTTGSTTASK